MSKFWLVFLVLIPFVFNAQEVVNLYPGAIPNSIPSTRVERTAGFIRNVTIPTLEMYIPSKEKSTGVAVIVVPGGSYGGLAFQGEGIRTAKALMENGIAAFVLKYRLPDDSIMVDKKIGPLQDAQQSIKWVRENAEKYGIDPAKIGMMGFSAGGHLASTAGTHFAKTHIPNENKTSLRPDFLILIYPVISMSDALTHKDSRKNLLGLSPSQQIIELYSNENQVTPETPPTYLTHTGDDKLVDVDNSIVFYQSLKKNKVPAELHLFPHGDHGFVLKQDTEVWMAPLYLWMKNSKWLTK